VCRLVEVEEPVNYSIVELKEEKGEEEEVSFQGLIKLF
jgi:hypothetical protein